MHSLARHLDLQQRPRNVWTKLELRTSCHREVASKAKTVGCHKAPIQWLILSSKLLQAREEKQCSANSKEYMSDLLHLYVSQMGDMCNVRPLPHVHMKQSSHKAAFQILVNVSKPSQKPEQPASKAVLYLLNKCQESNMSAWHRWADLDHIGPPTLNMLATLKLLLK